MITANDARGFCKNYWENPVTNSSSDEIIKSILYMLDIRIRNASKGGLLQIAEIVNLPHDEELWKVGKELIGNPVKELLEKNHFRVVLECECTDSNGVLGFEIDWAHMSKFSCPPHKL